MKRRPKENPDMTAVHEALRLGAEISRLQAENERLKQEINYNCRNEEAPCPTLKAAEQRVARECCEIAWRYVEGTDMEYTGKGICTDIKAKYGL